MLDPEHDLLPPSSPTISSVSSSDLDTESTGSFFHDRSTTLGSLMGVNFPEIIARVPSQRENNVGAAIVGGSGGAAPAEARRGRGKSKRVVATGAAAGERKRRRTRRRWWNLCRDDSAKPEQERRGEGRKEGEEEGNKILSIPSLPIFRLTVTRIEIHVSRSKEASANSPPYSSPQRSSVREDVIYFEHPSNGVAFSRYFIN